MDLLPSQLFEEKTIKTKEDLISIINLEQAKMNADIKTLNEEQQTEIINLKIEIEKLKVD